jgi:four helix bundle protein
MKNVNELDVYHKSLNLIAEIYQLTTNFPKYEIYGITSQLRRSAVSIGANLCEGFHRNSMKEFILIINISWDLQLN